MPVVKSVSTSGGYEMEGGYIKLSRQLLEWEWYDDLSTFRLWIHLLLTVNWKEGRYRGQEVKPGERVVSMHKLAEETGLSVATVMRCLNKLEKTGEVQTKRNTYGTLITVIKWGLFQQMEQDGETDVKHERNTSETRVKHGRNTDETPINRRRKEGKKERREILAKNSEPSFDYARNYTRQEKEEIYDRYFGKD